MVRPDLQRSGQEQFGVAVIAVAEMGEEIAELVQHVVVGQLEGDGARGRGQLTERVAV